MRPLILRPSSGIAVAIVIWVIAATILVSLTVVGDGPGAELWPVAPVVAAVAWFVWVALWWPRVRIAGEGLEVRNPFRTVQLPWDEVKDVDSRGTLVITTSAGRVTAWAAPPKNRAGERRTEFIARARQWRSTETPSRSAGRSPSDPDAAEIIRRVQSGRTRVPMTADEPYDSIVTSWNVIVIAVSIAFIVGSIASLI